MARGREYEIAFKLDAELESTFGKSFQQASKDLNELQRNVKNYDGEYKKAVQNAERYSKNLGRAIKAGVGIAVGALAGMGAAAWNAAKDYDDATKAMQISTGRTGRELDMLESEFRDVMREVPNAADEVASTLANLDTFVGGTTEQIGDMGKQILDLSRMLKEDAVVNSEAFGKSLEQFQRPVKDAENLLDGMFKITQDTGIGFNKLTSEIQTYGSVMQNAGFSMEETADFFGLLNEQGLAVSRLMPGLNRSFRNWASEQKDPRAELEKTIQSMINAEKSADALAIATDVFGAEGAQRITVAARNGAFALDELGSSFEGVSGVIGRYSEETMTLDEKMQRLKNQMFQTLEPYGQRMIEQAEKAVQYFEKNGPKIIDIAEDVAKALVGIAIAAGTVKVGKGIFNAGMFVRNLSLIGRAAGTAGGDVAGMSGSVRVLSGLMRAIPTPMGLAVTAIGGVTAGIIAYRRHQENLRQDLINIGENLQETSENFQSVADRAKETNDLVWEYQHLRDIVEKNTDASKDLTYQKERIAEIEQILMDMFPERITQHDIENGRVADKVELLKQEADAERDLARLKLEKEVRENQRSLPDLEKEIESLREQSKEFRMQKDAIDEAIPSLKEFQLEFEKIMETESDEERGRRLDELREQINGVGEAFGVFFQHNLGLMTLGDTIEDLEDKSLNMIGELITTTEELETAESSYRELYDAQKALIELDLGASIEDQAQKYEELSDAEKERFQSALLNVIELEKRMDMLPDYKRIDVEMVFRDIGIPENVPDPRSIGRYGHNSLPDNSNMYRSVSDWLPELKQYGSGGLATEPSIFGEKGPEWAIPHNQRPSTMSLLDRVNKSLGYEGGGSGTNINATFSPNLYFGSGVGENVRQEASAALEEGYEKFKQFMRRLAQEERRLRFDA